ncbi:MAG: hypothetical protein CM1200mP35_04420 [Chloroflexota bacterium]|nr:MAG: hypothetical protein CM1200mP35_04420 [Chloroflexota bacterium]
MAKRAQPIREDHLEREETKQNLESGSVCFSN